MSKLLKDIGFLRLLLAGITAVCLPLVFLANGEPDGLMAIPVYVAPVLMVLIFWGLLFDMLMARVLGGDTDDAQRKAHFRNVLRFDVLELLAILAFWGPYYFALVQGG